MLREEYDYAQAAVPLINLVNELSEDAKQAFLRLLDPDYSNGSDSTSRLLQLISNLGINEQRSLYKLLEHRRNSEKRDYFRKKCSIMVGYLTEDGLKHDFAKNISAGGAFIETQEPFTVGQKFLMVLQVEYDEEPFLVMSEVRWINHEGIGVRFLLEHQEQEERLRWLIADL